MVYQVAEDRTAVQSDGIVRRRCTAAAVYYSSEIRRAVDSDGWRTWDEKVSGDGSAAVKCYVFASQLADRSVDVPVENRCMSDGRRLVLRG